MAKLKVKDIVAGAEQLSLGVSIVVAILLGTGLGYLVKKATNFTPALFKSIFYKLANFIFCLAYHPNG